MIVIQQQKINDGEIKMDNMDRQMIMAWLEDICGTQPEVQDLEAIKSVIEELIVEVRDVEVYNVGE